MFKYEEKVLKPQKLTDYLFGLGLKASQISYLFKNKDVKINGERYSQDTLLESGNLVTFFLREEISKKYSIVYEDDNIFIVNKFAGIEVVGDNSLEQQLNAYAVHRLDRNTKGLLILAKNNESKQELLNAFKKNNIIKKYLCEVVGATNYKNTCIKCYLFKDAKLSRVYIYDQPKPHSQEIKTIFTTLKSSPQTSVIECTLLTGKTHQIRAQLAHLGHAILGDGKYGKTEDNKKFKEGTQKLHCYYLKLTNLTDKLNYLNNKEFILYPEWFAIKN